MERTQLGGSDIVVFPKHDRFTTHYTAGALFVSHGMGMPARRSHCRNSMRMVFFLKRGDLDEMDKVFWCRGGNEVANRIAPAPSWSRPGADGGPQSLTGSSMAAMACTGSTVAFRRTCLQAVIAANADTPLN